MRSRDRWALVAGLFLLGVFAVTLVLSVIRRAESTFDYPDYSSLNNKDNGTKAYHDALDRLGFATSRNFEPIHRLTGTKANIFYAGVDLGSFRYTGKKELELYERIATEGGRLIFVFAPEGTIDAKPKKVGDKGKRPAKTSDAPVEKTLETRWGIQLGHRLLAKKKDAETAFLAQLELLPVNWYFASWTKEWTASHNRSDSPLFLERKYGEGSILLIVGAKCFTNRELLTTMDTQLLVDVPGERRQMIFDESHLGVADTGSVAGLATRHHLQWLLLGFLAVAGLYIWRSAVSFIPPPMMHVERAVAGADAFRTLSSLLTQSISQKLILRTAAEEWNRSKAIRKRSPVDFGVEELKRMDQLSPASVPREYNSLANRLK